MPVDSDNPNRIDRLQAAFAAFTEVSGQLEHSYTALQRQVEQLEGQLASANRRHALEAERNAELAGRLAALLEALPAGVIMLDGAGVVRELNATATDFLGAPLQDTAWNQVRERAFLPGGDEPGDLTLQDGRTVSLAQRLLNPESGRVLLFTDVTEHRKVQQLLARHRRLAAMGEMAAALAHQLRTPLSAALLYTSSAARADLPAERRQDLLDKATQCLHNLEQLIADMLQFARGASSTEERVGVSELLERVQTALQPALGKNQCLEIAGPNSSLSLSGNREALAGAILNLANNALQHAGNDARVQITAQRIGNDIRIRVRDNGPGVPPADRERIFDPFFTSRPDGTGLGLAVARSVARAHRGEITLESGYASGASFVLSLPVKADATNRTRLRPARSPEEAAA